MIFFLGGEGVGMLKVGDVVTVLREGEDCQFIGIRDRTSQYFLFKDMTFSPLLIL